MKVKIRKIFEEAQIPEYAKSGDAGMDLVAMSKHHDPYAEQYTYGTGLAFEIPEGYAGFIFPRSSIMSKPLRLSNCVGVIDSGYRGEVKFVFDELDYCSFEPYEIGDRIGQLIILPVPNIELEVCENLNDSDRGVGGFGSTGE